MQPGQNTVAIVSLITGIVSILCCFANFAIPGASCLGLVLAITAVVTGIIGMKKAKEMNGQGHGLALGGLILGGVQVLISIILIIVSLGALVAVLGLGAL
jgi:hypothetical protein